jgi:tetratricopeptide (TPR) repeat protein
LVDLQSARTLARFDSPDQHFVGHATFSPDGARLVVTTNDPTSCVHAWDLRIVRRRLAEMGLDWDAPAYPDDDPARADLPPLPPLHVDYGPLADHIELYSERPEVLLERSSARIKEDPKDVEAVHLRGHALLTLNRPGEALADFTAALVKRPLDAHLHANRGICLFLLQREPQALDEFETTLKLDPQSLRVNPNLQLRINERAWELANDPGPTRNPTLAVRMAKLEVAIAPEESITLNTLGVALYRSAGFAEAIEALDRSLTASRGELAAFDLFFLAMAHHRLGHRDEARACYDRAVRWLSEHKGLSEQYEKELAAFRAEAETVLGLARPGGELPADLFAPK